MPIEDIRPWEGETILQQGLVAGVPMEVYLDQPGASQSKLWQMRNTSPAHVRWRMDHPTEGTAAQQIGSALHMAVLQPSLFAEQYVRGIEGDGRKKEVKEARQQLALDHPGAIILKPEDYELCRLLYARVTQHPVASLLLDGPSEVSAVWREPGTDLACRGRYDVILESHRAIIDLKFIRDASPVKFSRAMYEYGWHFQGAHYLMGAMALGLQVDRFIIVAVEKTPPYGLAIYSVDHNDLNSGDAERHILMEQWRRCVEADVWPCYRDEITNLALPAWTENDIKARLEQAEMEGLV